MISFTATPRATATTFLPHVTAAGTPPPRPTPRPTPPGGGVSYRVTEITLPTYPYAADLSQTVGPECGRLPGDCA